MSCPSLLAQLFSVEFVTESKGECVTRAVGKIFTKSILSSLKTFLMKKVNEMYTV